MDKKWYLYKNAEKKDLNDDLIKVYGNKPFLNIVKTNEYITDFINSGKPFMVCRFGGTEMRTVYGFLKKKHFPFYSNNKGRMKSLCELSGFFPNDIKLGKKFVELILNDCKQIDLCAVWNLYMEDYVLDMYAPNAKTTFLPNIEPWMIAMSNTPQLIPWSVALKGKRVLVIHPFEESIRKQYCEHRNQLFAGIYPQGDLLPDFELLTIKAIQSLNCNIEKNDFSNWFDALDFMIDKCKKIDFDIAIIGCGAYGFPLAAEIKRMGKGAIHLGGATQLLFGVMGDRWKRDGYKEITSKFLNEYWTYPLPSEALKGSDVIEGGCYW